METKLIETKYWSPNVNDKNVLLLRVPKLDKGFIWYYFERPEEEYAYIGYCFVEEIILDIWKNTLRLREDGDGSDGCHLEPWPGEDRFYTKDEAKEYARKQGKPFLVQDDNGLGNHIEE